MKEIAITPRSFMSKDKVYIDKSKPVGYQIERNNSGGQYSKEELIEKTKDANTITTGNNPLSRETTDRAKNLKVASKYNAGLNNIDVDYANSKDTVIRKTSNTDSTSVTEMTILMTLSSLQKYIEIEGQVGNGRDIRFAGYELYQKDLGLTGPGAVGQHVAHTVHSMGMTITAHGPHIDKGKIPSHIEFRLPGEIYQYSDVISLHLPLLDSIRNIVNGSVFKKTKSSATLINIARDGLVDEKSLYTALSNQKIAFASEDIKLRERSKELTELRNYLITPHTASSTSEVDHSTMQIPIENVLQELEKE